MSRPLSKPAGETRLFVVPLGFPPPVKIGDKLPGGITVCQFSDRFVIGNRACWRFFVQRERKDAPEMQMSA